MGRAYKEFLRKIGIMPRAAGNSRPPKRNRIAESAASGAGDLPPSLTKRGPRLSTPRSASPSSSSSRSSSPSLAEMMSEDFRGRHVVEYPSDIERLEKGARKVAKKDFVKEKAKEVAAKRFYGSNPGNRRPTKSTVFAVSPSQKRKMDEMIARNQTKLGRGKQVDVPIKARAATVTRGDPHDSLHYHGNASRILKGTGIPGVNPSDRAKLQHFDSIKRK